MSTPDEEVAKAIVAEFQRLSMVGETGLGELNSRLAQGLLTESEWTVLFSESRIPIEE